MYILDQVVLVEDLDGWSPCSHSEGGARSPKAEDPEVRDEREMAPHSPDLNPCDFWLWGVVEEKASDRHQTGVAILKMAIRRAVASTYRDEARCACARFRRRVEQVKAAEGGHIQ